MWLFVECTIDRSVASLLNPVPCVPACERGLRVDVLAYQRGLCTNKLVKCHKVCHCFNLVCQPAKFLTWRTNVPKGVPIFQTFL